MSNISNNGGLWKLGAGLIVCFITVITTLSLFITNGIKTDINLTRNLIKDVDSKLFVHLTNHDIHIPREQVVSKKEFDLYRYALDEKFAQLNDNLKDYSSKKR